MMEGREYIEFISLHFVYVGHKTKLNMIYVIIFCILEKVYIYLKGGLVLRM